MTDEQWLFHYAEVMKNRRRKTERENTLIDILTTYMELIIKGVDPEFGNKVAMTRQVSKSKQDIPDEEAAAVYDQISEITPEFLDVKVNPGVEESKFILPVIDRKKLEKKPGISIGDK